VNKKVLLVEDDEIAQLIEKNILSGYGCDIETADSAKEAKEQLNTSNFSVIIMDIGSPDKNGDVLTKEIREELHIETPIIGLTAHIIDERKQKYLQLGMTDVIQKPITKEICDKVLGKYLK